VPEKAEAFLRWALLPASDELLTSVAICPWLAAPDRERLRFFRPITERVWVVGASLLTTDSIALYAVNTQAICHFGFKFPLKTQRRAHILDPLRDGSEKDEGFPRGARETTVARYKRSQLGVVEWSAKRKVIGFFGHIT
jgi:hypothetical protein